MRLALCAAVLIGIVALAEGQTNGTVLTSSEIQEPHRMRRPVAVEARNWLGLRILEDGSRVERVQVSWTGSVGPEDSVFTLSVEPPAPALLLADVPQVSVGPAVTLNQYELPLSSGAPLSFVLGSYHYTLALNGTAPTLCDATVTIEDGTLSQELYFPDEEMFSCGEPHFSVQWAGDLDGDGKLDLVSTFSPKYSYYPRRLFLSSAAPEGKLVGLVAVFEGAA